MDTKDKIIIILSVVTVILTLISVVLAVPSALSAINVLLHPQNSTPGINQENSTNKNINDISSSNFTNSNIENKNINTNGSDITVGDNNIKNIYNVNTPAETPAVTFTPVNLPTQTNSIGMEFVQIPSGSFVMGDNSYYYKIGENYHYDESPEHTVKFDKPFYMGKFEVTQKQWNKLMHDNPSSNENDDLPVNNVIWNNIQEFIKKLNQKEGTDKYRLPSEAEWEYACRAGTTTKYYFGDDASKLDDYEWYQRNSMNETHSVGTKKPNPWGLYDMLGNVYEWTLDDWHDDYTDAPTNGSAWYTTRNPEEPSYFDFVVLRGGAFDSRASECRSADRGNDARNNSYFSEYYGFRLVKEV